MASFTEAAITDGSHTNTVEDFFTSTQIRPLSNPQETMSPHEHIGPKADKGVSTVELGTTPKSRTALPSSVIINQTTADENVDWSTSAAGNILICPSPSPPAIIGQDSKTPFVNPMHVLPQIITIVDLTHTIKYISPSHYLFDDKTLARSLPAIKISGTPISLGPYPASQIIIGSTTITISIPRTPLHSYLTTSLVNSATKTSPFSDVPAAFATRVHLPKLSRPAFTTNPAGYTEVNRSNTETGGSVPGVAVLPTGQVLPSSKESTPIPLTANAAVRMESGAWGLFVPGFGLGICLWWM